MSQQTRTCSSVLVQGGRWVLFFKVVLLFSGSAIPLGLTAAFMVRLASTSSVQLAEGKEIIDETCIFLINPGLEMAHDSSFVA